MQILLGRMALTTIICSQSRRFQIFFQCTSSIGMTKAYICSITFLVFSLQKHTVLKKVLVRCYTNFWKKNDPNLITQEKFSKGKSKAIAYILNKREQFSIRKDGFYHHYVCETFYSSLLRTQKRFNEIYITWYSISKADISNGHPLLKAIKNIDEKGLRLFYCNKNVVNLM